FSSSPSVQFECLSTTKELDRTRTRINIGGAFPRWRNFGTFLRSQLKFSKLLVQSSHHCVTCAHQKSSFSFL
uniref:Uncharacterized protein n=1 Tax=Amphiprion percula TaxID=161767 RepID=A0A3P8SPH2_AMPPE